MKQLPVESALVPWNVISGFEMGTADERLTSMVLQEHGERGSVRQAFRDMMFTLVFVRLSSGSPFVLTSSVVVCLQGVV